MWRPDLPSSTVSLQHRSSLSPSSALERVEAKAALFARARSPALGGVAVPVLTSLGPHPAPTEFDTEAYLDSPEYQQAIAGKKEVRRWKLYKATPNTAPTDA